MIDHAMLDRQGDKQALAVAELREVARQLLAITDRLLAVAEVFAGTTQVTMLMAEVNKPKDEDAP